MTPFHRSTVVACLVFIAAPSTAHAQQSGARESSKWEVEVHVGGVSGRNAQGGTPIARMPEGTPILLGSTVVSRAIPSWYFGDGASFLNEVNGRFGVAQIVSLDPVLTRSLAERRAGASFGARISRTLTSRLGLELGVDYSRAALRISDTNAAAIEDTRESFELAWRGLIGTGFTFNPVISSTADLSTGSSSQVGVTGVLTVGLRRGTRMLPYAAIGAGGMFNRGSTPSATLTGSYRFDFADQFPIDEMDTIVVRARQKDRTFVGVVGGGFKYALTPRQGIRVDARLLIGPDPISTVVDTRPSVKTLTPAFAIATGLPGVQFSNNPSTGRVSSLSRPPIEGLETFTGGGVRTALNLTAGYFFRFGPAPLSRPPARAGRPQEARMRPDSRRWQIEAHGLWASAGGANEGEGLETFPVGQPFSTGLGTASRAISSWYFGDGAALANAAFVQFGLRRIEPLDDMLRASLVERKGSGGFGVRVTRELSRRFDAELSLDRLGVGGDELVDEARDALEASRTSFAAAFRALLTPESIVTSELTVTPGNRSQLRATGAVNVTLARGPSARLFVTAGAGSLFNRGTGPSATLNGGYRFTIVSSLIADEHDAVTVRTTMKDRVLVFLIGGGVDVRLTPRQGIRGDVRFHVAENPVNTVVDASPSRVVNTPGTMALLPANPSIQFSSRAVTPSTLSGPPVSGLESFTGSGRNVQMNLSVGYYVRF